jgi:hypothetical protein
MSVRIGEVKPRLDHTPTAAMHVQASRAGVELHCDPKITLEPTEARNAAALLVRAAEEVEMMRKRFSGQP